VIHVCPYASQIFKFASIDLGFEHRVDDVPRGFRCLTGAREKIRIPIARNAFIGNDFDEQPASDGEMIGRRDQWLGVGHLEYGGFNGFDLHRLLGLQLPQFTTKLLPDRYHTPAKIRHSGQRDISRLRSSFYARNSDDQWC
jgi:hypothetical protein